MHRTITMSSAMIFCCECQKDVVARMTTGLEVYPHHEHLHYMTFWVCDDCHNYVGCHAKTDDPTKPLGCIPTKDMRRARSKLHALIDPVWQRGKLTRGRVYKIMAKEMGVRRFHVAETRSLNDIRDAYWAAKRVFRKQLEQTTQQRTGQ